MLFAFTVGACYQVGSFGQRTKNQVFGANLSVFLANQGKILCLIMSFV